MNPGAAELIVMTGGLAAAAVALVGPDRWRRPLIWIALILAPILIGIENWDTRRFEDLRDDPMLLIGGGIGAAVTTSVLALAFRRWPIAFPLAALATLSVRIPVGIGGEDAHLLLPLYLVIAAGAIACAPRAGAFRPHGAWVWTMRALALVLVIYAVQAAYGPGFAQAAENAGFFFIPFAVLFILLASIEWDARLTRLALLIVAVEALAFTAVALGQYATGELWWNDKVIEGNQYHEWFRVNSLFWDPNIFGRYLVVSATFTAAVLAHAPTSRSAWLAAGVTVAMLAGLAASFSQSALLSLLAGLAVIVALRWGVRRTAVGIGACLALALAALAITGTPDLSEERIEAETTGRASLIRGGLELAGDAPLQGHGSGSFATEYRHKFGRDGGVAVSSHSEPVTVAAEQGAVGMLAYIALVVCAGMALGSRLVSRRNGPGASWIQAARVGVIAAFAAMVVNSIAYAAFLTDPITWALLAAGLALSTPHLHAYREGEAEAMGGSWT